MLWSRAASRWLLRPPALAAPSRVFPSTASPRNWPLTGVRRSASQRPSAASRASPSRRISTLRTVLSAGRSRCGITGSGRRPSASST